MTKEFRRRLIFLLLVVLFHDTTARYWHSRQSIGIRGGSDATKEDVELLEDCQVYSGWRIVFQRRVRLRHGKEVIFDVVKQRGTDQAAIVFVYNSTDKTVTLVEEYFPSTHSFVRGLAAGMVDANEEPLETAKRELEEECGLTGGTWIELARESVMDKYATTRISAYLAIDPKHLPEGANPAVDEDEDISVIDGVSIDELVASASRMSIVGQWATLLALQKLRQLKEIA